MINTSRYSGVSVEDDSAIQLFNISVIVLHRVTGIFQILLFELYFLMHGADSNRMVAAGTTAQTTGTAIWASALLGQSVDFFTLYFLSLFFSFPRRVRVLQYSFVQVLFSDFRGGRTSQQVHARLESRKQPDCELHFFKQTGVDK